jgi:pilus assembly protein Flp/PilA
MDMQGSTDMLGEFANDEAGQGLVEYAMIIMLVSIVVILALTTLGGTISGLLDSVGGAFP